MIFLKDPQWDVFESSARFRVLVAGRRFGKTYLAMVELCQAAWKSGRLAWYVAPTYKQAKRIAWKPLKEMTRPYWASKPNETDLRIELITGGTICLRGADNRDSLRGDGLDFVVLDEYASMHPETWTEVLRPSLADKQGKALFIGTPRGFNHFHDLYRVKDRIYSVNGMLKNQAGERRLLIDPRCKELIEDFEQVVWKTDPHGNSLSEVDKSNKHRTHLSDALGYMIHYDFAMLPKSGERAGFIA